MKAPIIILFLFWYLGSNAQSGFDQDNYDSYYDLNNYIAESSEMKTSIDYRCAIFVSPSEPQLQRMKKVYGEDFYTVADDNSYYNYLASELLDKYSIEMIYLEAGTLELVGETTGSSWKLDTGKEGAPGWNLIFFTPHKKPLIVSAVDVSEDQVKAYFDIQDE